MESFSLLKYWRSGAGGAAIAGTMRASASASASAAATNPANTTTIAASLLHPSSDAGDQDTATDDEDDEGSFFDLEFTAIADVGDDEGAEAKEEAAESDEEDEGQERDFNFAVSSETNAAGDGSLRTETFSPSDDLFFKGKLVPLEPSSFVIDASEAAAAEAAVAGSESDPKPQLPVSFLKSSNKFRVFTLGFRRKPNAAPTESNVIATSATEATATAAAPAPAKRRQQQQQQNKFFIKFKVEEVPIVSLFTRDNSARSSSGANKVTKPPMESAAAAPSQPTPAVGVDEKKFPKEVVHKYLSKIKPLYVRVSKRYGDRLRLTGPLPHGIAAPVSTEKGEETDAESETAAPPPTQPSSSGINIPGLKVVRKRLGKSRSASAAVAAAPPAVPPQRRRDDSLLQQQDGIQSAIAHCKRSFTAGDNRDDDPTSPPLHL